MTEGEFNQFPPKCSGLCPLTEEFVQESGMALTKNCKGPRPASAGVENTTYLAQGGDVVEITGPKPASDLGKMACSNAGAAHWLTAKQDQFNQLGRA